MIQYIADAFTDKLFAGNPAAVLPCREMPAPQLMQSIAIENNYSETAFVVRPGADGGYTMDFPVGAYKPVPVTEGILAATNGLAREAWYDGGDMMVLIGSEADLAALVPDYEAMGRVEGRGLIITAPSSRYDFVSRCFYPKLNVPEDPVTGSAHTYLTPLWAGRLGKKEMTAGQLSARGGELGVRLEGNRVFITGRAVLFMQGEIPFDL